MNDFFKKQAPPQALHFVLGASCASGILVGHTIAVVVSVGVSWLVAIAVQVIGRVLKDKPVIDSDMRAYAVVIVVSCLIVTFQTVVIDSAVNLNPVVVGTALASLLAIAREGLSLPAQRADDALLDMSTTALGGFVIGIVGVFVSAR